MSEWLLDLVWPRFCLVCGCEGLLCCRDCQSQLELKKEQNCPVCRRLSVGGRVCDSCRSQSSLDGLVIVLENSAIAAAIIYKYKYQDYYRLDQILAAKMAELFSGLDLDYDLISFVPLARRRYWWRGYNQAELLAKGLAGRIKGEVAAVLCRRKFRRTQVGLNRQQRMANISGVFGLEKINSWSGKKIILVDDVCSSQATLDECAWVLKQAGAVSVWGLVLMRGT